MISITEKSCGRKKQQESNDRIALKYVDVCLINEGQAKDVLGIHGKYEDEGTEEHRKENCRSVAEQVADRFGCKNSCSYFADKHFPLV